MRLDLWKIAFRESKAGFGPNQPRAPRGQPDGGQWIDAGGSNGRSGPKDAPQGDRSPVSITIYYPRSRNDGSGDEGASTSDISPLGDPPNVPLQEPETNRALNEFIKGAAYWLAKALLREAANPAVGTFVNVLEAAYWGYKTYPYIKAYLDPPKTLDELQRAVSNPAIGYDAHHIVEQTAAARAGYPRIIIDAPENLVRIPTLKHWQITGWYMTPNEDFGGASPREYLRRRDWEEHLRVGHKALVDFGVLGP